MISSPYPCSEPLHKTPNQAAITVHCAERHGGVSPSFACLKQHALSWAVLGSGRPLRSGGNRIDCSARQSTDGRTGVQVSGRASDREACVTPGRGWFGIGRLGNWAIEKRSGQRSVLGNGPGWESAAGAALTRWSSRWGLKSGVDVVSQQQASRNGSTQRNR